MRKKIFLPFIIFVMCLLSSCVNTLEEKNYGGNGLTLGLGDSAAVSIIRAAAANEDVCNETVFSVVCSLFQGENFIKDMSEDVPLKDLGKVSFTFDRIPNGADYFIAMDVFYKGALIYNGKSDFIELSNGNNNDFDVSIQLVQHYSSVTYELNGGDFASGTLRPDKYFINSDIGLPVPVKDFNEFNGWYLSDKFQPSEKITSIGKKYFAGDIKLYAKWTEFKKVPAVKITPEEADIDWDSSVTLECDMADSFIYYTVDGSEPSSASTLYDSKNPIVLSDLWKDDTVVIKAMAEVDGMASSGITEKTYKMSRYTVSFDTGNPGIKAPESIKNFKKGDKISAEQLVKIEKADCEFLGWLFNSAEVKAGYVVTGDMVLTPNWREFDAVADVTFSPTGSVDAGTNITLSTKTTGATIYYTDNGTEPTTDSNIYSSPITINDNTVIKAFATKDGMKKSKVTTADYKVKLYKVLFSNGGKGNETVSPIELKKGDKIPAHKLTGIKANGYTFEKWIDDTGAEINDSYTIKGETSLTAHWIPTEYSITYNVGNLGVVNPGSNPLTFTIESNDISLAVPEKSGYTMKWMCSGEPITRIAQGMTGNMVLDLEATPITYKVVYDLNGGKTADGSSTAPVVIKDCTYDVPFNLEDCTNYKKSGFRSLGIWNTKADGTGTDYSGNISNLTDVDGSTVTLYTKWEIAVPDEVIGLTVNSIGDGTQIKLAWQNPADDNLKTVEITYVEEGSSSPVTVSGIVDGCETHTVTGLTVAKKYTFTVKTVNKQGIKSKTGMTVSCDAMRPLALVPTKLTNYSSTFAPASGTWTYVEFGVWPQSLKKSTVNILGTKPKKINTWDCYYGDDGYYYVKNIIWYKRSSGETFTDGTVIDENAEYYFKLEPLRWRILNENYNYSDGSTSGKTGRLMLLETAVSIKRYQYTAFCNNDRTIGGQTIHANNYEHSQIRAFLQGAAYTEKNGEEGTEGTLVTKSDYVDKGFIQNAFGTEGINKYLDNVSVDNSSTTTFAYGDNSGNTNTYACRNTVDKAFLLSVQEITNPDYGFQGIKVNDVARSRNNTDYMLSEYPESSVNNAKSLALRSPSSQDAEYRQICNSTGAVNNFDTTQYEYFVVPAIVIPESAVISGM